MSDYEQKRELIREHMGRVAQEASPQNPTACALMFLLQEELRRTECEAGLPPVTD